MLWQPPFEGDTEDDLFEAILNEEIMYPAWLGRDADTTAADWPAMREEAASAHNARTARYLLGMPTLGDVLEEGLSMLGHSCAEYEMGRL